jgi:heme/copper-type cytochrome/quinol oxidase subunit 2
MAATVAGLLLSAGSALGAADTRGGWGDWWLPPQHSTHGAAIDSLFNWIFWITMVAFIVVEVVLVVFLVKYRARPERKKAHFTHGNTRLEMAWTLAPAVILAVLALASKKVWDNYRYSPKGDDPGRAIVLVIGEQFKWNVIYPGPDGKLGAYLKFPKPSDAHWPGGITYQGTKGPAELPYEKAIQAINAYIGDVNTLGKDLDDPDGKDDNWELRPGREIVLPKGRPIEVQLSSKDVIHDFFLPNFRVKLDAVPGMRGRIFFESTMSTTEREKATRRTLKIDELLAAMKNPAHKELTLVVDDNSPGSEFYKPRQGPGYRRYADKDKKTIARNNTVVTDEIAQKLKEAGVTEVVAFLPGTWELVCEELCGGQHTTMRGVVRFLEPEDYDKRKLDKSYEDKVREAAEHTPVAVGAAR